MAKEAFIINKSTSPTYRNSLKEASYGLESDQQNKIASLKNSDLPPLSSSMIYLGVKFTFIPEDCTLKTLDTLPSTPL